jgi:hypothetical protein
VKEEVARSGGEVLACKRRVLCTRGREGEAQVVVSRREAAGSPRRGASLQRRRPPPDGPAQAKGSPRASPRRRGPQARRRPSALALCIVVVPAPLPRRAAACVAPHASTLRRTEKSDTVLLAKVRRAGVFFLLQRTARKGTGGESKPGSGPSAALRGRPGRLALARRLVALERELLLPVRADERLAEGPETREP